MNGVISSLTTILSAVIGYLGAIYLQKRGKKQSLIDAIMQRRTAAYGEALALIYQVENNQTKAEELDSITDKWSKWFPLNAAYLPPFINDAVFRAMSFATVISIGLHNDGEVDPETFSEFKTRLQNAKMAAMELKDIGWLPKDL